MFELFDKLCGTCKATSTAAYSFTFGADSVRVANRAAIRKYENLCITWAFFRDHAHHLRNHIASTLDYNMIADTDIFARYFIFIMQCCV